jgi:O-antigen/teichoic acid export membrane protein
MVLVFTALGNVFVDSGIGQALIQRQRTTIDEETSAFAINMAIALVASSILVLSAPTIAHFYEQPDIASLCKAVAVIFPLNALAVVPDALLTQQLRFRERTRVELGSSLFSGLLAIALAAGGLGAWALAGQAIASIGARTIMLYVVSGWRPHGQYRSSSARSIAAFGGYMLVAGLIDTAYTRLQAVLIGKLFSPSDLGYYSLAQNTQQAPTSFAAALLNRLGLPLLSAANSDAGTFRRILRVALRMSLFAFAPLMVLLAVYAEPVVSLVYGERWRPAGGLLAILSLAAIPWPAHVLSLVALNAMGLPRLVLRVEIMKKSVAVALLLASAPWGLAAIAWSTVAVSVMSYAFNAWFVSRHIAYGLRRQALDLLPTVITTLCTAAVGIVCAAHLPPSLLGIATGITMAALTHLVAGHWLGHPAVEGFVELIRRRSH